MSNAALQGLTAIEKISSVDYLEQVFACYREGRVAVPIDAGASAPGGLRFDRHVTPARGGGWFTRAQAPIDSDAPAQISFSSGTTGEPKAILLSHRALADVTERLIAMMGINADIREYLGVPATYSFGLARARVVAAVGGRLYLPERGFDPGELSAMLEAGEVNALSAVPTLLRVLLANPELIGPAAAGKLRWLEIGSQPMSAEDKQGICRLFPAARIVQHYGLTEASRTTFLDLQGADARQLAGVGMPTGAAQVRVDDDGHICVRGPHVASGIVTESGLAPVVDAAGWLRTNDLGSLDADGSLHFLGRADDLLNVGGIKVPAALFEQRLAAAIGPDAAAIGVVGHADPLRGEIVVVAHLRDVPAERLRAQALVVARGFGLGAADLRLAEVAEIPRTATGKIRRSALVGQIDAAWSAAAAPVRARAAEGDAPLSAREEEIAAIWRDALGVSTVSRHDTFFDLGGDSLSAISAMVRMERAGISKDITQQIFEGRSIAEIAGTAGAPDEAAPRPASRRAETSDAIVLTRGIMVGVVIGGHWLPFLLVRMGSLSQPLIYWSYPFFRFGTPGFAIVFGIGLGFFNLSLFGSNPQRFRANLRRSLAILAAGVGTLALANAAAHALGGSGDVTIATLFYGVLFAYLLLVLASGPILYLLSKSREPALAALVLGLVSLSVAAIFSTWWSTGSNAGLFDFARLMVSTKYGFPEMLGYAALGMAMGIWFERSAGDARLPDQAILAGVAALCASMALTVSLDLGPLWFSGKSWIHMLVAYCGVLLLLFGLFLRGIRHGAMKGAAKGPMRVLLMIGVLAFPAYVGHEAVMAIRGILAAFNVPDVIAIGAPILLFLAALGYAARRLFRLHYG